MYESADILREPGQVVNFKRLCHFENIESSLKVQTNQLRNLITATTALSGSDVMVCLSGLGCGQQKRQTNQIIIKIKKHVYLKLIKAELQPFPFSANLHLLFCTVVPVSHSHLPSLPSIILLLSIISLRCSCPSNQSGDCTTKVSSTQWPAEENV